MFRGNIVALVTPFHDDKIDFDSLKKLIEWHVSAGTHAIVVNGTTGEAGTLSRQEKLSLIKTVVDEVNERIPIIAGTSMNATKECIELTRAAMDCGADAALLMTPSYIKPTQEGLFLHYSLIANNVPMPIILYNVPNRTACDLHPITVARLAKISNIIGIKEAVCDMLRLQQLLDLCPEIDIYSGDDLTAAAWMQAGAKGVISVAANIVPQYITQLANAALNNDSNICGQLTRQLTPLYKNIFIETNPIPVKWALSRMGLIRDELRLPMTSLAKEYRLLIEQTLRELQLI